MDGAPGKISAPVEFRSLQQEAEARGLFSEHRLFAASENSNAGGHIPSAQFVAAAASQQGEFRENINDTGDHMDVRDDAPQSRSLYASVSPSNAAQNMLHFMRTTRGRMKGHVHVRRHQACPWQQMYCVISKNGALRSEQEDEDALLATLLRDLRGCKVYALVDSLSRTAILHVKAGGGEELELKPENDKYFDVWFAALLCWQPVTTKLHVQQKIEMPRRRQLTALRGDHVFVDSRATRIHSQPAILIEPSAIELHALQNDASATKQAQSPVASRGQHEAKQTKVLCTLYGDGKLVLQHQSAGHPTMATVRLGDLPRSSIQRLDKQLFEQGHVIGVYPQYASSSETCSQLRPILLAYGCIESLEAWFVLLRTFAVPEIYFTQQPQPFSSQTASVDSPVLDPGPLSKYLRMEQSLGVTVNRVRFHGSEKSEKDTAYNMTLGASNGQYYIEILVDEQIRMRTSNTSDASDPFWYECHHLQDLSNAVSTFSVRVMKISPANQYQRLSTYSESPAFAQYFSSSSVPAVIAPSESFCGEVNIKASDLDESVEKDQWWPITGDSGSIIGEVSLKMQFSRDYVLAGKSYDRLLRLLRETSNGLTLKIWRQVPGQLAKLAECFLNIFQASGRAIKWLEYLAEEEINNGSRQAENSPKRLRHDDPSRIVNELSTTPEAKIDKRNTAIAETSILFRANSLLTKALDLFMRRVGSAYLKDTIGAKLREILTNNDNCEVDPTKEPGASEDDLAQNWLRLLKLTGEVWKLIYESSSKCPFEVKVVLQHIRVCANKQFGNVIPTVVYSSVSGFLFLRFFCAAIMNPHIFGLINARPPPHTLRTYLLVAKAIQGLANMATFGAKESWMAPMNTFYSTHRQELMYFIDSICAVSTANVGGLKSHRRRALPASSLYDTPLALCKRLPPVSREGSLSLPHLIDRPRNLAQLVELWMNNFDRTSLRNSLSKALQAGHGEKSANSASPHTLTLTTLKSVLDKDDDDEDLAKFHEICRSLRHRTNALVKQAMIDATLTKRPNERSEQEDSGLSSASQKWVKISERIEIAPEEFWIRKVPPPQQPTSSTTSLPGNTQHPGWQQRPDPKRRQTPRSIDTMSRASGESSRRIRLGGGSKRKDSTSTTSGGDRSHSSNEGHSKSGKKVNPPSPPPRDAEENALRKLGWI